MDAVELKTLSIKLSVLLDMIEQNSRESVKDVSQSARQLDRTAQTVMSGTRRLVGETIDIIRSQTQDAVQSGLQKGAEGFTAHLQQAQQSVVASARQLQEEREALKRARYGLVWQASITLLIGSLLATGGSAYIVWKNMAEIRQTEFATDILQAAQSGLLTRCGERLCAKVGKTGARFGKQDEYVLLQQ